MKASTWYIVFIVVLLGILIAMEYTMPKKFIWKATFSQYDKQPFGAAIFDDIVSASIPEGYSVVDKTFYQLEQDSLQNTSLLAVNDFLRLDRVDMDALLNIAGNGNKVMLVANTFGYALADSLGFEVHSEYFQLSKFRESLSGKGGHDTIVWLQDSLYNRKIYITNSHIISGSFAVDTTVTILAQKDFSPYDYSLPLAIKYPIGKGELYLVCSPLLFTNYGILESNYSEYIFRLLTQLKGMPLIRTEAYNRKVAREPQTPFRYLLSQPPLRWGIYLTFLTLVLFMIFTARRRQRAIPVVRPPQNKSLEFIELIGTLYFQKKESADLVRKKYIYFAETLRRTIQVDLDDNTNDEKHARRIAAKTGIDQIKISRLLISLRNVLDNKEAYMTEDLMKQYINSMNEVLKYIEL